jgi:2-iminobutanoate/2-iminopropanoate deaminase
MAGVGSSTQKEVVDVGLPPLSQPFSWATKKNGFVFTAHGPVRADGTINVGSIEEQARLTFENLQRTLIAAGGTLDDVMQVLIYMTDIGDMPKIDVIYREFFREPYPNRSSFAVVALAVPAMKIEIVAYAIV